MDSPVVFLTVGEDIVVGTQDMASSSGKNMTILSSADLLASLYMEIWIPFLINDAESFPSSRSEPSEEPGRCIMLLLTIILSWRAGGDVMTR